MSKSKAIGTRAETKVRRYFESHGLRCERRALAGSEDEGDLRLYLNDGTEVTVEVKAGKQTASYGRKLLDKWKTQTLIESRNSRCRQSILVVVRYARRFVDAEVWVPNFEWWNLMQPDWTMMYIDDFVEWAGGK